MSATPVGTDGVAIVVAAVESRASARADCRNVRHVGCEPNGVFRVTVQQVDTTTIVVEGRLCGPWVDELERCWRDLVATRAPRTVTVQLDGLTFVDADGKALCRRMYAAGTGLAASGCMMRAVVEEIAQ